MPEGEQWEEFNDNSIFLAKYKDADVSNNLFRLHDFYVELSSDSKLELNHAMNAFLSGPRLEKYVQSDYDYINKELEIDWPYI